MNTTETAWLAGLLEGEGTFAFRGQHGVKLILSMTDEDVVRRAALVMRATQKVRKLIRNNRNAKPQFIIEVSGFNCERVMAEILPLMGERRSSKIKEIQGLLAGQRATELERRRVGSAKKWKDPVYRSAHTGIKHWHKPSHVEIPTGASSSTAAVSSGISLHF